MAESKYNEEQLSERERLLLNKVKSLQQEVDELRRSQTINQASTSSKAPHKYTKERSASFWATIIEEFSSDADSVKRRIKNKKISFTDHLNGWWQNILLIAAIHGNYELVQFCINMGADLKFKDKDRRTAEDHARLNGHYHIEQLLQFAEMNVNVGNEAKDVAETMLKQQGISKNILSELDEIGKENKELFIKTLMELMIRLIRKRKSFSDDMLNLCWQITEEAGQDPLKSELWSTIKATCTEVIQSGNTVDWYWLKQCLLPSTVE